MARTVRDFRKIAMDQIPDWIERRTQVDASTRLWEKLNRLGERNIDKIPPEEVPDIDATVNLTDQEWNKLALEMNNL